MKNYSERTDAVIYKMETKRMERKRRRAWIAGIGGFCVAAVLLAVLFVPFSTEPPDVSVYRSSPYYQVIQTLNKATYKKPEYKNNFEMLKDTLGDMFLLGSAAKGDMMNGTAGDGALNEGVTMAPGYQEVTDNQVAGVIEADLFKRTDTHIFYLRELTLEAYIIAQADSAKVGSYTLPLDMNKGWLNSSEMYLSRDGKTVTVLLSGYGNLGGQTSRSFTCVVSLDVSNPADIQEVGRIYMTGSYLSSRLVDGKLLVMSQMSVWNPDFDKEETFLPQIGAPGNMQSIPAENIICPDDVTSRQYTVVTALNEKDLSAADHAAFLGYTDQIYVSQDNIYATREYISEYTMTEVSWLYYGETLERKGSISITGWVKDQYSMDEYEGILRVVTSTNNGGNLNASLYCIDIESRKVIASVENFAPDGERAESVRFDGAMAYVCTAEVITMTDPVYFFDLSDLENITCKDTGTIDGYSSSLVNFGDGFLLGIGYGDGRELKIEVYAETETGVESVSSYVLEADFSEDYKSYLIDRENRLVGLGVYDWQTGQPQYILVGFDGVRLTQIKEEPLAGNLTSMRATVVDGWLYMLGGEFKTLQIW